MSGCWFLFSWQHNTDAYFWDQIALCRTLQWHFTTWSGTAGSTQKPDFRRITIVFDGFRCVFLQITCHWHATCRLYAFGYLRTRGSKNRYLPWYNTSCTRGTSGRCPRRHGTTFPIRLACRENVFSMVYTVCTCLTWLSCRLLRLAKVVSNVNVIVFQVLIFQTHILMVFTYD